MCPVYKEKDFIGDDMRLGIMQPYFFPYIGYWQLIESVDKYVVYDDVNYIKGGWINRNQILFNGKKQYFGIRLCHASPNKLINEINILDDPIYRHKMIRSLENVYKNAPVFNRCMSVLESILLSKETNLALFLYNQIKVICEYLHIDTSIILSSQIKKDNHLRGQDKVIHMCKIVGADKYYNAIGGKNLYQKDIFDKNNIKLYFLKTHPIKYKQYKQKNFIDNLSIIDIMMNLEVNEIEQLMKGYDLE